MTEKSYRHKDSVGRGNIILLMGISGSGKTTLGKKLQAALAKENNRGVEFIDGDHTRLFIGHDIGYSEQERFLITKIMVYAATLLANNGTHVVVSNIAGKAYVREYMAAKWNEHIQIFLDANIDDCIAHDPKGVYREALQQNPPHIMGLDIPYDRPENPDLVLNPYCESVDQSLAKILHLLHDRGIINRKLL